MAAYVFMFACFGVCASVTLTPAATDGLTPQKPTLPITTTLGGPLAPSTSAAPALRICYSCQFISSVGHCHHAKRCQPEQSCLFGKAGTSGFYLGCIPKVACEGLRPVFETQGSVTFLGTKFTEFQCCNTDRCNRSPHENPGPVGK